MSYIRCFVKHHMIDFNYKVFKGCFCIHMKPETYAINSIIHQFLHQTSDTLLHKVAHYFALPSHPCQQFVKDYFEQITGRFLISPLKRVLSSKDTTFKEILGNCPGIINVTYQPLKEEEKEANNDCKDENELQKISIIFPWAPFIMDNCHYFELDDSFYGIKPYVYCVTHAIFFNKSILVSIGIAPQECAELYLMMFNDIKILHNAINWKDKFALSDMGKSIIAACKAFEVTQFFCHRHISEHFGSTNVLGLFVLKLLKCHSYHKYEQIRLEIIEELDLYVKEREKDHSDSSDFKKKVRDLRVMLNGYDADNSSNYYIANWALWIRREHNVCRCSNHEEGFHSYINRSLEDHSFN